MNESCHIRISHVTSEWVMSPLLLGMSHLFWASGQMCRWALPEESYQIWMSRVMYDWVMSHINQSHHTCVERRGKCVAVHCCNTLQHTATHLCRTSWRMCCSALQKHTAAHYTSLVQMLWQMRHLLHPMSHVSPMNEFYVTHLNSSSHTYEWVTSHIWMSHVTHMNESCLTHMNESCHTWISHG